MKNEKIIFGLGLGWVKFFILLVFRVSGVLIFFLGSMFLSKNHTVCAVISAAALSNFGSPKSPKNAAPIRGAAPFRV